MKKIVFVPAFILCLLALNPLVAQQTYTQAIPRMVTEIHYSPSTQITSVTRGTESAIVVDCDTVVAVVKRNRMTILPFVKEVKIVINESAHHIDLIPDFTVDATKSSLIASEDMQKVPGNEPKSIWFNRDVRLDFTWGLHNWGTDPFNGFEGVEGNAAIRTNFNHIHLSLNFPLLGTRHFATYIGLGMEWDKYKFEGKEMTLDLTATPYGFVDGGDVACSSWMRTRYVVMPVSFRFDFGRGSKWNLTLSAIPGIHWGGSHTGLRREYITDLEERIDYDQSINKHINPYKFDVRAMLVYGRVGIYCQLPMLSAMSNSAQELYPIKCGVVLSVD